MKNVVSPPPQGPLITFSSELNLLFLTTNHSVRILPIFGDLYSGLELESLNLNEGDIGQEVFFFNLEEEGDEFDENGLEVTSVDIEGMSLVIGYGEGYLRIGFYFDQRTLKFKFRPKSKTPLSQLKIKQSFPEEIFRELDHNSFNHSK